MGFSLGFVQNLGPCSSTFFTSGGTVASPTQERDLAWGRSALFLLLGERDPRPFPQEIPRLEGQPEVFLVHPFGRSFAGTRAKTPHLQGVSESAYLLPHFCS